MRRLLVVVLLLAGCARPPAPEPSLPSPQLANLTTSSPEKPKPREIQVGKAPSPQVSPSAAPSPVRPSPAPARQAPPVAVKTPEAPVEVPLTGQPETPTEVEVKPPSSDGPVEVAVGAPATGDVALASQAGTAAVLSDNQPHLLYMLVEARAGETVAEQWPINLALVIDTSQSMQAARKLDYAIEAVGKALDRVRPIDFFSVIVFAQSAHTVLKAPGTRGDLNMLIRRSPVGEGTNMYAGIEEALSEIRPNQGADKLNHVLLLTDGVTVSPDRCLQDALQANREGVSFSVIGLGRDCNQALLREIADRCNGRFYNLDSPVQLPAIFDQELKGVRNVQLRNNKMVVNLEPGVRIRRAHRILPQIRDLGEPTGPEVSLPLGDLRQGETLSVLFELSVPAHRPGIARIATARVEHDVPAGGTVSGGSHPLEVKFTTDRTEAGAQSGPVNAAVDAVTRYTHRGSR